MVLGNVYKPIWRKIPKSLEASILKFGHERDIPMRDGQKQTLSYNDMNLPKFSCIINRHLELVWGMFTPIRHEINHLNILIMRTGFRASV